MSTANKAVTIPPVPTGVELADDERATWAALNTEYALSLEERDALAQALQLRSQSRALIADGTRTGDAKLLNAGLTAARTSASCMQMLWGPMRRKLARTPDTPRAGRGGVAGAIRNTDGRTVALR